MRRDETKIENKLEFKQIIKRGIISQLYKDGFLPESIYRKLTLSAGLPLEKPAEKAEGIAKKH